MSPAHVDTQEYAASVGCLLERTDPNKVLGTVFLVDALRAATCASILAPYEDLQVALTVCFPALDRYFAVAGITFHPGFDRWKYRRTRGTLLYPPPATEQSNVAVIDLATSFSPVPKDTLEKLTFAPPEEADVTGTTSNIDIANHLQTYCNARSAGTMTLCDQRWRQVARIYCEKGMITHVRYYKFVNENALFKLIQEPAEYNFYFLEDEGESWRNFPAMTRGLASLLVDAFRRKDELEQIQKSLDMRASVFCRAHKVKYDQLPPEAQEYARAIWPTLDGMPLEYALRKYPFDNYSTLRTIDVLYRTGHVALEVEPRSQTPSVPNLLALPIGAADTPLRNNRIFCVSSDLVLRNPVIDYGTVMGPLRRGDPSRQVLRMALPREALGAPILKHGRVVGIHTGSLCMEPADRHDNTDRAEMCWVAAVRQCLGATPKGQQIADMSQFRLPGFATSEQLQGQEPEPIAAPDEEEWLAVTPVPDRKIDLFGMIGRMFSKHKKKEDDWAEIHLLHAKCGEWAWQRATTFSAFRVGDMFKLEIKIQRDCFVYVIYQASGKRDVQLVYPRSIDDDQTHSIGSMVYFPAHNPESINLRHTTTKLFAPGVPISNVSGTDSVLVVCSTAQLPVNKDDALKIFKQSMIALNGLRNLEFLETSYAQLVDGNEAPANGSRVAVAKLRISPKP